MLSFSLASHFDDYFEIVPVRDAPTREAVFRLRFAVYCSELAYEDETAFPDGQERDTYDDDSEFALIRHRATGRAAGCVRLIVDGYRPALRFPFEQVCAGRLDSAEIDLATLDRGAMGEISRLAVHQDFRRRHGEVGSPEGLTDPPSHMGSDRRYPLVAMGLFLAASALALNRGLAEVIVMMEPRLARLLTSCGLSFTRIGDVIDYHGRRGPFRIRRSELLSNMNQESEELLRLMIAALA